MVTEMWHYLDCSMCDLFSLLLRKLIAVNIGSHIQTYGKRWRLVFSGRLGSVSSCLFISNIQNICLSRCEGAWEILHFFQFFSWTDSVKSSLVYLLLLWFPCFCRTSFLLFENVLIFNATGVKCCVVALKVSPHFIIMHIVFSDPLGFRSFFFSFLTFTQMWRY